MEVAMETQALLGTATRDIEERQLPARRERAHKGSPSVALSSITAESLVTQLLERQLLSRAG